MNPKDEAARLKADMSLLPGAALAHTCVAFADGEKKYGRCNWRRIKIAALVYSAAAVRHIKRWEDGLDYDPVSGAHELAHAVSSLMIILDAMECGTLIDNRPAKGETDATIARLAAKALPSIKWQAEAKLPGCDGCGDWSDPKACESCGEWQPGTEYTIREDICDDCVNAGIVNVPSEHNCSCEVCKDHWKR